MIKNNTLCILDIETTGFEPEESEIVEIYILKVQDNKIIDEIPLKNVSDLLSIPFNELKNRALRKKLILIQNVLLKN